MMNRNADEYTCAIRENASLGCLTWRAWPELQMHFDKNSFWFTSDIQSPVFNTIVELDPSSPICESYLQSIAEQLPVVSTPLAWMIPQEANKDPELLKRHNYLYLGSTRGMICELSSQNIATQRDFRNHHHDVHRVTDDEALYDWAHVIAETYHFQNECRFPWFDMHRSIGYGEGNLWEHFVLYNGDKPTGACSLFWGPEVPSLANVAVLPEMKGQGQGRALIERALLEAKEIADPEYLTLYATEEGFPLYKKLGFEQICSTDIYQRAAILH